MKMSLNETELKKIIGEIVRKKLSERTLLKVPNSGGQDTPPPEDMSPPEDMNMEEQPPMEDEMPMEEPPQQEFSDPHISELVELLNANPDRAEGVLKYAKGIIGTDTVPQDMNMGDDVPPPGAENMGESRSFDLDEMISDIITNGVGKRKSTISRPIAQVHSIKGRMFRPTMGSS